MVVFDTDYNIVQTIHVILQNITNKGGNSLGIFVNSSSSFGIAHSTEKFVELDS